MRNSNLDHNLIHVSDRLQQPCFKERPRWVTNSKGQGVFFSRGRLVAQNADFSIEPHSNLSSMFIFFRDFYTLQGVIVLMLV